MREGVRSIIRGFRGVRWRCRSGLCSRLVCGRIRLCLAVVCSLAVGGLFCGRQGTSSSTAMARRCCFDIAVSFCWTMRKRVMASFSWTLILDYERSASVRALTRVKDLPRSKMRAPF